MPPQKRVLTVALTLALGLGVWAASFSYQAATFSDGDVLSAAALNGLLNDNFQAAADALDERMHRDGDTMRGPLVITPRAYAGSPVFATASATGAGDLIVRVWDAGGDRTTARFSLVTFRPGS